MVLLDSSSRTMAIERDLNLFFFILVNKPTFINLYVFNFSYSFNLAKISNLILYNIIQ